MPAGEGPGVAARVGVVGHVEWVQFASVDHVPIAGEIVHARDAFETAAGGGAVAAVQLRKLAGAALFLTAVGGDDTGARAAAQLRDVQGLELHASVAAAPQRRAFTFVDAAAERTITVLGERVVPVRADALPWAALSALDAVYFTGGDAGAVRAARAARVLVATPRALDALIAAGVQIDVLVGSADDPGEAVAEGALDPPPRVIVRTRGAQGGEWELAGEPAPWVPTGMRAGTWAAAAPPAAVCDAYGCGDSFAAGLTYGLGAGMDLPRALALGARCGAACLAGRGPYAGQCEWVDET